MAPQPATPSYSFDFVLGAKQDLDQTGFVPSRLATCSWGPWVAIWLVLWPIAVFTLVLDMLGTSLSDGNEPG